MYQSQTSRRQRACAVGKLADARRQALAGCSWLAGKADRRWAGARISDVQEMRRGWFARPQSARGRGRALLGGALRLIRGLKFSAPYLTTTSSLSPRRTTHHTSQPTARSPPRNPQTHAAGSPQRARSQAASCSARPTKALFPHKATCSQIYNHSGCICIRPVTTLSDRNRRRSCKNSVTYESLVATTIAPTASLLL